MTCKREFEFESRRETVISWRRAATASGRHHGLDARSSCCPLGLEAITSAVGDAESRATHVTRNREFEFESRHETVVSLRRAATASGRHHGLDARSVCCSLGLEAITSAVGGADSRATHMTRNIDRHSNSKVTSVT